MPSKACPSPSAPSGVRNGPQLFPSTRPGQRDPGTAAAVRGGRAPNDRHAPNRRRTARPPAGAPARPTAAARGMSDSWGAGLGRDPPGGPERRRKRPRRAAAARSAAFPSTAPDRRIARQERPRPRARSQSGKRPCGNKARKQLDRQGVIIPPDPSTVISGVSTGSRQGRCPVPASASVCDR